MGSYRLNAAARLRFTPFTIAIRLAMAAVLYAGIEPGAGARSVPTTTDRGYNIPAGPLGPALTRYAQQAGVSLVFDASKTHNLHTDGLRGHYAVQDGFNRLLLGSGYVISQTSTGYMLAVATPASTKPARPVTAAAIGSAAPRQGTTLATVNVTGQTVEEVNPATTIGSKIALTQRETPQSVSVVTQHDIAVQNLQTVDDAIRMTPGMSVTWLNPNDTAYTSRGFAISTFQLDGVPTVIPGGGSAAVADNLAMYDRVEILRGPAGLMNGFGGDGGVVNLVRKSAPGVLAASATVATGNYNQMRSQGELGGPLNAAGTLRGLLVMAEQYQHLAQDSTWQRDKQFYGVLEADLTPSTLLRVGASHTRTKGRLMYGLPYDNDFKLVEEPRSSYLGADENSFGNAHSNEFVELQHHFGDDWTAKIAYNHLDTDTSYMNGIAGGPVDPATNIGDLYDYSYRSRDRQDAIDAYIAGSFDLFGQTHQLTFGANYLNEVDRGTQYFINEASGYDVWGDVYTDIHDNTAYAPFSDFAGGPQARSTNATRQYGLYANVRWHLADPLTLVTGGRLTSWETRQTVPADPNLNYYGNADSSSRISAKFSPMVGLIYDLGQTYSTYLSYTSIFVPQTGDYTTSGAIIAPVEGAQYEAGLKGAYFHGRANASVAVFCINEQNNAVADDAHPGFYLPQGKVRSQGVEFQVNGELATGWTMLAGYTFDALHRDDNNASNDFATGITPKHLFKLSTDYRLPGAAGKWSVGASFYAQTGTYFAFGSDVTRAAGYGTADLRVGYQISPHLSAQLSATNLTNKYYWKSISGAGSYLGDPRRVLLSLHASL